MATPEQIKASYRRNLKETVVIRRFTGTGTNRPKFEASARAQVVGYAPHELIGGIVQGDRKIILYADDLIEQGWAPAPGTRRLITENDFAVVRGAQLAIIAADDSTRRVDGTLIAFELQVRGG